MLVTYKSKAAADVLMLGDLAKTLMGIMGRELTERGIFTHEQLPALIAKLEAAIQGDDALPTETTERDEKGDEVQRERLRLAQRAFPLLDMMRAAHKVGEEVLWGV